MSDPTPVPSQQPGGYSVQPQPYTLQQGGVPGASLDPRATAVLVPWGHLAVLVLAVIGLAVNVLAGANFPGNAPVEWIMNAGITINLVAVVIACAIGVSVSRRRRLARPARAFPWVGLALAGLAFASWLLSSAGLWDTLFLGGRGHYMNDIGGAFIAGVPWVLGAIFSAYGVRKRSTGHLNLVAIIGIVLWGIVLVGVLASAALYGVDLTD